MCVYKSDIGSHDIIIQLVPLNMLKRDILCKKVNKIPFLRSIIMSKSAFFTEIVFFSQKWGIFFLCFFLLNSAGRTGAAIRDSFGTKEPFFLVSFTKLKINSVVILCSKLRLLSVIINPFHLFLINIQDYNW